MGVSLFLFHFSDFVNQCTLNRLESCNHLRNCSIHYSLHSLPLLLPCVAYNVPELEKKPMVSVYRPLRGHLSRLSMKYCT